MTNRQRSTVILRGGIALSCALAACRPTATRTAPAPVAAAPSAQAQRSPMFVGPTSLAAHRIVPVPLSVTPGSGAFALTSSTSIVVPSGNAEVARTGDMLAMLLRVPTGLPIPVTAASGAAPSGAIVLRLGGPSSLGDEGYEPAITIFVDQAIGGELVRTAPGRIRDDVLHGVAQHTLQAWQ